MMERTSVTKNKKKKRLISNNVYFFTGIPPSFHEMLDQHKLFLTFKISGIMSMNVRGEGKCHNKPFALPRRMAFTFFVKCWILTRDNYPAPPKIVSSSHEKRSPVNRLPRQVSNVLLDSTKLFTLSFQVPHIYKNSNIADFSLVFFFNSLIPSFLFCFGRWLCSSCFCEGNLVF